VGERSRQVGVQGREIIGTGWPPTGQTGEDPVEPLPELHGVPKGAACRLGTARGLPSEATGIRLGQEPRLDAEPEQLAVVREPVGGLVAPPPAHRVGEVEAEGAVAQVEDPRLHGPCPLILRGSNLLG